MKNENLDRYTEAIAPVSPKLRDALSAAPEKIKAETQEIRLRQGKPLVLAGLYGTCFVGRGGRVSYLSPESAVTVSGAEVADTLSRICSYSVYAHQDSITKGFITYGGGFRAGICGTAVVGDSSVKSVRNISSINIRVAREHAGAADGLMRLLFCGGLKNIIISGPPSSGKTTMLRDLSRQLSSGQNGSFYKVALIDERCELAGVTGSSQMNDVGVCCDVLSGYPKAEAIIQAVRTLSPEYIICDEIGSLGETAAIEQGVNSGVKFAVSIHAGSTEELFSRPQAKRLLALRAFEFAVMLESSGKPGEIREIRNLDEYYDEIIGGGNYFDIINSGRRAFVKRSVVKSNGA